MTRIKIDTPGVSVEIDADEPLAKVKAAALDAFKRAGGWPQESEGPATGFTAERRYTAPVADSSMGRKFGPYRETGLGFVADGDNRTVTVADESTLPAGTGGAIPRAEANGGSH